MYRKKERGKEKMGIFSFDEQIAEMKAEDIIKYLSDEQQKESLMKLLTEEEAKTKDNIFLLSVGEYEELKKFIPPWSNWWWLRSPGCTQAHATIVFNDGSVGYLGNHVSNNAGCVRPVIRYKNFNFSRAKYDTVFALGHTWKIIDEELAIAESPIFTDKFNTGSNNYENSEIRRKMLKWADKRRHW